MSEVNRADELARQIAALVGWCGIREESDREKALMQLWREWSEETGHKTGPKDHPKLSNSRIHELARQHDEHRAQMREQINRVVEVLSR